VAAGLLTGLAGALFGRPAQRTLRITVFFGVAVAVVRDLQRGILDGRGVLAALALSAVICQVADAAVSRRAQFAADLFAADRGLAIELARALRALHGPSNPTYGWSRRLHRTHPTPENRISALLTVRVDSKRRISCRSGAATRRPAAA
jgi:STE24 endopeptidase